MVSWILKVLVTDLQLWIFGYLFGTKKLQPNYICNKQHERNPIGAAKRSICIYLEYFSETSNVFIHVQKEK